MKKELYTPLLALLRAHGVHVAMHGNEWTFSKGTKSCQYFVVEPSSPPLPSASSFVLPADFLVSSPEKIMALILSKLHLNKRIFARLCDIKKVDKKTAGLFLDSYHLMKSTQSAFNFGLFYKNDLLAVASFSKGRKMNRLQADQRSYELIRFCCKSGISVTGGLTRLVNHFCAEKNAGDIMTYVDKHFSDGSSFVKAGFKKHSETAATYFLVDKKTFERVPCVQDEKYDSENFYLSKNAGNIKLVYTPLLKPIRVDTSLNA